MIDSLHASDVDGARDVAKSVIKRDRNNLALADQIQFSSILKILVDPPEKTLELAQAATKKPSEPDEPRPETPEREDRPVRRTDGRSDRAHEDDQPRRVREPRIERVDRAANTLSATSDDFASEQAAASAPASTDQSPVQRLVPNPPQARRIGLETLQAPEAVAALVASRTSELAPSELPDGPSAKPQAMLVRAAQTMASSAPSDNRLSRAGEDLRNAIARKPAGNVGSPAEAASAASSMKELQEADLASRLGTAGQFAVQVDLGTETAKMRANPLHALTAGATIAEFDGADVDSRPFGQAFGQSNGDPLGADHKAAPTHGNLLAERPLPGMGAHDWASTFNQALRSQGAVVAAQQSAQAGAEPAAQPLPSEAIQANGIAAPTGPSQASQLAKAAPASAPRQPERPQAPAEQIAVKIRQAVGEGADKITIKLQPANLGRVEVRLDIKDGHISATVLAERKETLELLQRDAHGLERALLGAGLQTDIQSLSFGLRGDGQKQVDVSRDRRGNATGRSPDGIDRELDEGIPGKASGTGRNLRPNGGVDIKV